MLCSKPSERRRPWLVAARSEVAARLTSVDMGRVSIVQASWSARPLALARIQVRRAASTLAARARIVARHRDGRRMAHAIGGEGVLSCASTRYESEILLSSMDIRRRATSEAAVLSRARSRTEGSCSRLWKDRRAAPPWERPQEHSV